MHPGGDEITHLNALNQLVNGHNCTAEFVPGNTGRLDACHRRLTRLPAGAFVAQTFHAIALPAAKVADWLKRQTRYSQGVRHAFLTRRSRLSSSLPALLAAAAFCVPHILAQTSIPVAVPDQTVQAVQIAPVTSQSHNSITGTVVDANGDGIVGARVTLSTINPSTEQTVRVDEDGIYTFTDVSGQTYKLSISASGFSASASSGALKPGEDMVIPPITLSAGTQIDVEVSSLSQEEVAEKQIHVEEQQKLLGAIPNYFVSYDWHAAPLTSKQKIELTWHTLASPANLVIDGGIAGVEQAENALKGYGPGAMGYARRYGAASGDFLFGTTLGGAVFPVLLRQDPRYFYKGTGSVPSRALYALSTAFICKGDNGKWQPSYSGVLGDLSAGAISNLYYPSTDRHGWGLTLQNGLISAGLDGVGNLIQEFVLKHVTPHVQTAVASIP